jgi:4-hydroxy-tetrahydrodipicolinate reductase
VRICLNGRGGKVGRVLAPAFEAEGHALVGVDVADVVVDFTVPEAVEPNVGAAADRGIPAVIGTTGFDREHVDEIARGANVVCFHAPNFAIGAVLMMRLAAEAAKVLPRAEIVELHNEAKRDAPSGTARETAQLLATEPRIHSVRLPGLVAHQEVLFGGDGQLLTIRHDTFSREAFVPGVLLALEKLESLPPGLTIGLEALLD